MHTHLASLATSFASLQLPSDPEQASIMSFFAEAGWTAKLVLAILIGFSLVSWGIMLWKHTQLRKAKRQSAQFLDTFRKSTRFSEANAAAKMLKDSPLAGIFQAGYAEIDAQIKARGNDPAEGAKKFQIRSLTAVERSLHRAIGVEILHLTRGNQFLATTAASTPFIGLFGTVWGIMVAFREIGLTGSTSIVTVAPGIAEALVNTAAGLGAAIPALIGFNHFANRLRRLRSRMEDFVMEFLNLTERNFT